MASVSENTKLLVKDSDGKHTGVTKEAIFRSPDQHGEYFGSICRMYFGDVAHGYVLKTLSPTGKIISSNIVVDDILNSKHNVDNNTIKVELDNSKYTLVVNKPANYGIVDGWVDFVN